MLRLRLLRQRGTVEDEPWSLLKPVRPHQPKHVGELRYSSLRIELPSLVDMRRTVDELILFIQLMGAGIIAGTQTYEKQTVTVNKIMGKDL